jgi:hypothetical protein
MFHHFLNPIIFLKLIMPVISADLRRHLACQVPALCTSSQFVRLSILTASLLHMHAL